MEAARADRGAAAPTVVALLGAAGVLVGCLLPWARVGATWRNGFRFANLLLELPDLDAGPVGPGGIGLLCYAVPTGAVAVAASVLLAPRRRATRWTVLLAAGVVVAALVVDLWVVLAGVAAIGPGPAVTTAAGTVALAGGVSAMRGGRREHAGDL